MTHQPTKGPLEICGVDWGGTSWGAAQVRNPAGEVLAVFRGPDCDANARLFVHAAKLVEAARAVVDSGRELRFQEAWNDIDEDEGADFEADLSDLRAVIAEIEGEKS